MKIEIRLDQGQKPGAQVELPVWSDKDLKPSSAASQGADHQEDGS